MFTYTMLVSLYKVSQLQITMSIIATTSFKFVTFSYQQTPLHVAASNGSDYIVKCLVKKGADMNLRDRKGVSVKLYL